VKSVELFVGAGGLALGTARAGFLHEIVLEKEARICRCLERNKRAGLEHVRDWTIVNSAVEQYNFTRHEGQVHFVFGGPPCQPFSLGGKHHGHEDGRNLFPQAVRAVREIQPLAFMFENVKGLLREGFSNYFNYIIHQLRYPTVERVGEEEWSHHLARLERIHTSGDGPGLFYNVIHQSLDSADYGVPQRRHRVFIVGIRSDLGAKFAFPEATHEQDALTYAKWVTAEYWDFHRIPKSRRECPDPRQIAKAAELKTYHPSLLLQRWSTVRDVISDLPEGPTGRLSREVPDHFFNPGARTYQGHTGSMYDEPAKAIKAGYNGVPGGENMLRLDNGSVRYFSVRECARLQTFPDDWTFEDTWTSGMRQLGNAVPVDLATVVARRLADVVNAARGNDLPPSTRT
jgi:DNA (cytosine-5)-methyltransferase 1